MKDSPSFKTLISSLLSGTLDKFNTFVEIGSGDCDVGPGSFFECSYFACSSLITENSKYFDKVVELQQKTLHTFNNLTHKTTELNKNILDNSNIIIEAINNVNRTTNSNVPRNDKNLDTLSRNTEEFDADVQVELQKRKKLHCQIYRAQSLSSYYQSLLNHENPFVPAKFIAKVNTTTPEYEKEIRRKQSIETTKREIDILDERRRNWLVELEHYEQAIHNIVITPSKK